MNELSNLTLRKFIEEYDLSDYEIETDCGFVDINKLLVTIKYEKYCIKTKNNLILYCADNHILYDEFYNEKYAKDFQKHDKIITKYGIDEVIDVHSTNVFENMYDLQLTDESKHRYYTNGFLSHNTLIAKKLAQEVFGSEQNLVRIDMSEFSEKSSVTKMCGCFTPDMKVLMSDGSYKSIIDIKIGEHVITPNGNIKQVLNKYEYDFDGQLDVYRVANNTEKIKCTPNHELLTIKSSFYKNGKFNTKSYDINELKFNESKNVSKKDISVYPRHINFEQKPIQYDLFDYVKNLQTYECNENFVWTNHLEDRKINRFINLDENLARLIGYYVSEGGVDKKYKEINFTFNINEVDYVNEVIKLFENVFNIKNYHISNKPQRNTSVLRFHNRVISYFLSELCGRIVYEKQIPKEIFNTSSNVQLNFIETAFYGDGNKTSKNQTRYTTVSTKLGEQITTLLRNLGYNAQIQIRQNKCTKYNVKPLFYVYLSGNDIDKFNNEMPNLRILRENKGNKNIHRHFNIDDSFFYNQILNKENEYYNGKVYDLTIEDDSCYIVNTMSVHNSNPGFIGYENGGQLTEAIKNKQHCVLLLDEIEKANEEIFNIFLQVFDEGRLTDNSGQLINFKNVIVLMTSNIGAKKAAEFGNGLGFVNDVNDNKKNIIEKELKKTFKPEFLNRIDQIVYFNSLTDENLREIINLELAQLNSRMNEINFSIQYDDDTINFIHGFAVEEKEYGARPIKRLIQTYIEDGITDLLLAKDYENNYIFKTRIEDGKLIIE